MAELGKIDREYFDEYVYPHLGAQRTDVTLGPNHGVDFGVVEIGDRAMAMATDPFFVMPSLGFERAAWFATHILLSDVAVSGLEPAYLSVDLNLPPELTDEQFATLWQTVDREATALDVSVVTGHTGRYAGCNYPMVGGGTAMAVGDPDELVRPDGARPGDRIVITKGPAIEATALLAIQFADQVALDGDALEAAQDRFYDMSPVEDALLAAETGGVTAMHDATECGIEGGLYEMSRAAGVAIDVDRDAIPVMDGVREACAAFEIDMWSSISEGTLLCAVAPDAVDELLAAFDGAGIPAADVGSVAEGAGVSVDGEPIDHPEHDPYWAAVERFLQQD